MPMANTAIKGVEGFPAIHNRQAIIEDAVARILKGQALADIAAIHGIGRSTLSLWLANMEGYDTIRALWIDAQLTEADEMLREAPDALELARARELLRSAQWKAERRDQRYRQQQVVQQDTTITVVLDPGAGRTYPQAERVDSDV